MHVGIDALALRRPYGGVQRSIWGLLEGMAELERRGELAPGDRFTIVTGRGVKMPEMGKRFSLRRTLFRPESRTLRLFYQHFLLHRRFFRNGTDLVHGPAYTLPNLGFLPMVVTIHDTIALEAPALVPKRNAAHFGRFVPKAVRRAIRIITPSEAVGERIRALFPEAADKVRVVPFGVEKEFLEKVPPPLPPEAPVPKGRYILFTGVLETKKNLETLLKAFFAAAMATQSNTDLLLVGADGGERKRLERLAASLGFRERIHFTGYVPRQWLPAIFRRAEAVVIPSVAEGFGFPVLEAMASRTLVVASALPALKEIGGNVPLYFTPGHTPSLREILEQVMRGGPADRAGRERAGFKRASNYTWMKCAFETLRVYRRALEDARRSHGKDHPK